MFCPLCGNWYDDDKGECACGYVDPNFVKKEEASTTNSIPTGVMDIRPDSSSAEKVEKVSFEEEKNSEKERVTETVIEKNASAEQSGTAATTYIPAWLKFLKYSVLLNLVFNAVGIFTHLHFNLFSIIIIIVNGLLGFFSLAMYTDFDEGYDDTLSDANFYYYGYLITSGIFLLIRVFVYGQPLLPLDLTKLGVFFLLTMVFKHLIKQNSHLFTKKYERKK